MAVVKFAQAPSTPLAPDASADRGTRERISDLLLRNGDMTVSELAIELGLAPTGVRRHLDAMQADGLVTEKSIEAGRRGRPARRFTLTDEGREEFPHTYDDLAVAALRHLATIGGRAAVRDFADAQVAGLEARCRAAMDGAGADPVARAEALAEALSVEGYAATAQSLASGGQLCQRHCPVAHVAEEFPELCQAETEVIARLVGSHVQRLATIARGDGVCTTHVPAGTIDHLTTGSARSTNSDQHAIATAHR